MTREIIRWTEKQNDDIRRMWPDPIFSIGEICSSIGKTHKAIRNYTSRLGLRRGRHIPPPRQPAVKLRRIAQKKPPEGKKKPKPKRFIQIVHKAQIPPPVMPISIADEALRSYHCRSVVEGMRIDGLAVYCGGTVMRGAYCAAHAGVYYVAS